ncbi:MAG: hypothetical protein QX199_05715 [Methylococcaceae bacterium]
MTKYIVFYVCFLFSGSALAAQKENINWYNTELVVKGDYLHALLVAEKDFSARISDKASKSRNSGSGFDNKVVVYLSKIDNYNFEIAFGKGNFTVWITPRLSDEFPVIFGGDASYTIDSKTFKIQDTQYGK